MESVLDCKQTPPPNHSDLLVLAKLIQRGSGQLGQVASRTGCQLHSLGCAYLRRQISNLYWIGVMYHNLFDAHQSKIFGWQVS